MASGPRRGETAVGVTQGEEGELGNSETVLLWEMERVAETGWAALKGGGDLKHQSAGFSEALRPLISQPDDTDH